MPYYSAADDASRVMLKALKQCVANINQLAEAANQHKMARGLGRAVHAEDFTEAALKAIEAAEAAGIKV